jgi:hypothetical protein
LQEKRPYLFYQSRNQGRNVVSASPRHAENGVDARIFNLQGHQGNFQRSYPGLEIPVVYGEIEDLPFISRAYDAIVMTFNPSVTWAAPSFSAAQHTVFGYYIQDFEPYFYPPGSSGYNQAWKSYTLIPNMMRFSKTEWTSQQIKDQIQVDCAVVGCSFDVDLFCPRPRTGPDWPDRPLKIAAMIRPNSPYRAPEATMITLKSVSQKYGGGVEFIYLVPDLMIQDSPL